MADKFVFGLDSGVNDVFIELYAEMLKLVTAMI